jgi:carboxyl-terminal processing protease
MVNKKLGILFLFSVILAFLAGFFAQRILPSTPQQNSSGMFDYIIQSFENYYYYDVDDEEIHAAFIKTMEAAIKSIAEANGDPYTRLLAIPLSASPSDDEKFVGVGISFLFEDQHIRIGYVYPQGPAHGLMFPNDLIIGMKDEGNPIYFKDLSSEDAVIQRLKGTLNEEKIFIVKDPLGNERDVVITYQEILTPTAYQKDLGEEHIAYIHITSFAGVSETSIGTAAVFQNILNQLEQTVLNGTNKTLILDLRDNPGGALTALHNQGQASMLPGITQQLLARNLERPLFTMIPKSGTVQNFYGNLSQPKSYDIKVLVNEHSASAAEVLAAVLNTEGGYELYGRPTYGKGVYQNQVRLSDIRNVRYVLVYTEGEWYYGDGLNVATTPLDVHFIAATGMRNIEMPIFSRVMSKDHVYSELSSYQQFLNVYYGLTGINALRTDGYYDELTRQKVMQYNTEKELTGDVISLETARHIHLDYMYAMSSLTHDDELQVLIQLIKSA